MSGAGWFVVASAPNPGAIGIIEINGDVLGALSTLSGRVTWPLGRLQRVWLRDVDDGLGVRTAGDRAIVMPHGGLRVIERLTAYLVAAGFERRDADDGLARALHPEARDECEALMLLALARAASPLAIDLLLDQPRRWRDPSLGEVAPDCAKRLDRLLTPARVVLVGPPNVGKSTLSNALFGRRVSIPLDRPGTTRDYTAGLVALDALVVRWHDTPGLRATSDSAEERAIALAEDLIARADLVVAMTDPEHDWPNLARRPDLRVSNKLDAGRAPGADLHVSAATGLGLSRFATAVRDCLVPPGDLADPRRWRFSEGLPGAPRS